MERVKAVQTLWELLLVCMGFLDFIFSVLGATSAVGLVTVPQSSVCSE